MVHIPTKILSKDLTFKQVIDSYGSHISQGKGSRCLQPVGPFRTLTVFFGHAGDHSGGHGGAAGLWFGQRPRLRRDGRQEGASRPRTAGLLQVREAAHDPHEEPLGREGVERPVERQVRAALPPGGHNPPLQPFYF